MTTHATRQPRRTFTDDFKRQMVLLYQNGKSRTDIIQEYDLRKSALDRWIQQFTHSQSFNLKDNRSDEENELIKLRKELKILRMENDILKQAALIIGRK